MRFIQWWKVCLDCGYWEKGETRYLSFNYWFCDHCNSKHLKGGFIIEEKLDDSPV